MQAILQTDIEFLKGVGPNRGKLLRSELGINTFSDLLHHFPFRYVDRSRFYTTSELQADMPHVQLRGTLENLKLVGQPRQQRLTGQLRDEQGTVDLVWFKGARWIAPSLKEGTEYVVFGKPNVFKKGFSIPHPEMEPADQWEKGMNANLQPVYHTTEKLSAKGLNSRGLWKLVKTMLPQVYDVIPENLNEELVQWLGGIPRNEAFRQVHAPKDTQALKYSVRRLKFEELFYIQLLMLKQKQLMHESTDGQLFSKVGDLFNRFFSEKLPFELTGAQKRVVKEIRKDMGSGKQMNRLLQGDVGSGKTLVALLSMLIALDNNYQAAMMAPTEILAQQHFKTLSNFLEGLPVVVRILTGSTKTAERKSILTALKAGEIHILVGTHALLEDRVRFSNLGLVVADEQHKFGVAQRAKLWKKSEIPPHVLVMTATPIPRTLAMTVYGDLDVSVIDELPPGRKAVRTLHKMDSSRNAVFGFMEEQIKAGRQIYVVYPLIEESENFDYKDLMDGYESISRRFPLPEYAISIVHGRMAPADKDMEMERFAKGETQIMVATTVIEVGVDVPNASVMIIENAERFGLSQLHQLRGRVGRGAEQSYCVLMTGSELSPNGRKRIETMVNSTDGFHIAEVDLEIRGPGDIMGTQQSGIPGLRLADLTKDGELLKQARGAAKGLLETDPNLLADGNTAIKRTVEEKMKTEAVWGRIS